MTYGLAENSDVVAAEGLLPIGLAEGCRLKRNVSRDEALTYDDVEIPEGRLSDRLRQEQADAFRMTGMERWDHAPLTTRSSRAPRPTPRAPRARPCRAACPWFCQ